MKAAIIMVFDGEEYDYGTYPFDTNEEQKRVNDLAIKIRDERGCSTYVKAVE
mgnify:FL=1